MHCLGKAGSRAHIPVLAPFCGRGGMYTRSPEKAVPHGMGVRLSPPAPICSCGGREDTLRSDRSAQKHAGANPAMSTNLRPNRLSVRTPDSQSDKPGATPGWATIYGLIEYQLVHRPFKARKPGQHRLGLPFRRVVEQ